MFVDLVNAFDQVQREVIRFALRRKGVSEYLVNEAMSLHLGCKSAVWVEGELLYSFSYENWCSSMITFKLTDCNWHLSL